MHRLLIEGIAWVSLECPGALAISHRRVNGITVYLFSKVKPKASTDVVGVYHDQNKTSERRKVILSLFTVIFKQELHDEQKWLCQSHQVDQSKQLVSIGIEALPVDQPRHSGYDVKDTFALEVIQGDLLDIIVGI